MLGREQADRQQAPVAVAASSADAALSDDGDTDEAEDARAPDTATVTPANPAAGPDDAAIEAARQRRADRRGKKRR